MVRAIVQLLKILTIAVTALLIGTGGLRMFDYAVDRSVPDDAGYPVRVTIEDDDNAGEVADKLAEAGLIRSKLFFQAQLRFSGQQLKPNTYTLRKGTTVPEIVDRISGVGPADEGEEPVQLKVAIPEGLRREQIAEKADDAGIEGGSDGMLAAMDDVGPAEYEFLQQRPQGSNLEGYLFPATYNFMSNDAEGNVRQMLDAFDTTVTPEMRARAAEMNLTLHEVITLASIVEKEAAVADERPTIAAIYLNRYVNDMELEADPTVAYALGEMGERGEGTWWDPPSVEELETDHPYNTYVNIGLPPGPIANPGVASIRAVLYPAEVDYIFLLAKPDDSGEHVFATTIEEHNENLCNFGYELCQE